MTSHRNRRHARPSSPEKATPPWRQLHGRSHGKKLRDFHASLLQSLLPRIEIARGEGPLDPATLFDFAPAGIVMEIGFGGGEHLVGEASAHPQTGFIGCEPFVNGVAKLLASVDERGLANVRVYEGNALDILARLPDACLERVELLYPDPWPKQRHRKRRFVSPDSIAALARVIRPGGEWRFATDIDDYAAWTLQRVRASSMFAWTPRRDADWLMPWPGYQPTRFEERARREGRPSGYFTFIRC